MYLGFNLSYNLGSSPHIKYAVCCKAFKTLGFVIMLAEEFHHDMSIKVLYCDLVRPILNVWLCTCVVWDPHDTASDSIQLETVQSKCLRFTSYVLRLPSPPHDYTQVANIPTWSFFLS